MRVAVIASAPRGGLLHYAAQMSRALAARGHEVDLITARGHELDGPLGRARIRPALPASLRTPSEPPTGVRYLWRRALIAIRVVAASARTLWEVGRGGYDLVLLTDDLSVVPAATGALVLTRMPGPRKVAAICHEPVPRSRSGDGVYLESRPLLAALRRLYPRLDVVFVHGEASRRQFSDFWPPSRVEVIPHGNEELLAVEVPPPSDEERILFFGEWRRAKGISVLTSAFDRLVERRPRARLTIAGVPTPDAEPDRVRAWAARHDGRVTLVDRYLEIEELPPLFGSARVVAAPYLAGSQSGVVALAMTMGRAVVASDVGELPATVIDGETGRVVPSGDVDSLEQALAEILSDPGLAQQFGDAGRRRALDEFSWARVADRVEAAFA